MNKISEQLDMFDKSADINNFFIDLQKQNIINEMNWLNQNYYNELALKQHFFTVYNDMRNVLQIPIYSLKQLQNLAEFRANYLYNCLNNSNSQKIDTKPLKAIIEMLRLSGI